MKKQLLKSALMAVIGVGLLAGSAMALQLDFYTNISGQTLTVTDDSLINPKDNWEGVGNIGYSGSFYGWNINAIGDSQMGSSPSLNLAGIEATSTATSQLFVKITENFAPTNLDYHSVFASINASRNDFLNSDFIVTISDGALTVSHAFGSIPTNTLTERIDVSSLNFLNPWTMSLTAMLQGTGDGFKKASFDGVATAPVPEPATMLLFGTGVAGLAGVARRRKANKS